MDVNEVIAAATIGLVVVGVVQAIVVYMQLNNLNQATRATTYLGILDKSMQINSMIMSSPSIQKAVYRSDSSAECEVLTEADYCRQRMMVEMMVDFYDHVYHQRECLPPETYDKYLVFIRDMYRSCVPLRTYVDSNAQWYDEQFLAAMRADPQRAGN